MSFLYKCNSVDVCLTLFGIRGILSSLPSKKMKYKLTTMSFGREIMGIRQGSNDTLTHKELTKFTQLLIRVFKLWDADEFGWDCAERSGIYFTLLFERRV